MTINNWPIEERPREKLLNLGAKNLSDAELLAIFLRTGVRGKTALDVARDLLQELGGLKKLLNAELPHFAQFHGVGKAKFAMLKAGVELGRRYLEEKLKTGETLANSEMTKRFLMGRLGHYTHEVFGCLFLNTHNQVICFEELFQGTLDETSVYPREVVKRCLAHNAAKLILAHNHPSGNSMPSQSDQELTQLLKKSLRLMEVQVIDHLIVGADSTFSFAEAGLL